MNNYKISSKEGFFVGDPCHVLSDLYNGILLNENNQIKTSDQEHLIVPKGFEVNGVLLVEDIEMLIFDTAYGDGCYRGDNDIIYSVESGTIGVIPLELIDSQDGLIYGSCYRYWNQVEVCYDSGDLEINFLKDDGSRDYFFNIRTTCDDE